MKKDDKYDDYVRNHGGRFIPLVVESVVAICNKNASLNRRKNNVEMCQCLCKPHPTTCSCTLDFQYLNGIELFFCTACMTLRGPTSLDYFIVNNKKTIINNSYLLRLFYIFCDP